jgi:hypothetical protein
MDDSEDKDCRAWVKGKLMKLLMMTLGRMVKALRSLKTKEEEKVLRFSWTPGGGMHNDGPRSSMANTGTALDMLEVLSPKEAVKRYDRVKLLGDSGPAGTPGRMHMRPQERTEKVGVLTRLGTWFARHFYRLNDDAQRDHFASQIGDFAKHVVVALGADSLPSNTVDVVYLLTAASKEGDVQKEKPWTADTVCRVAAELLKRSEPVEISAEDIVSMQAQFWMLDHAVGLEIVERVSDSALLALKSAEVSFLHEVKQNLRSATSAEARLQSTQIAPTKGASVPRSPKTERWNTGGSLRSPRQPGTTQERVVYL